jgi:hypothetical protein
MRRYLADPALRRGVCDGIGVGVVMAVVVVLTNVVFPVGPNESDGDPEYVRQILAAYALLGLLLVLIGAHGRSAASTPWAGARAGAVAGLVIVALTVAAFLVVDNVFLAVVSQQHDKVVMFASSHWSSMRAWVNVQLLGGAAFALPAAVVLGGLLGFLGGQLLAGAGERERTRGSG